MIAWMLYLALVSVLLAVAARLTEGALLLHGRAVRHVWLAALAGSLAVPLFLRVTPAADRPLPTVFELPVSSAATDAATPAHARSLLDRIQLPARVERAAGIAWTASAVLAFVGLSLFFGGISLAARRWPRGRVDDAEVRVSSDAGPAVFGLLWPVIVVPAWLVDCPAEVRQLALMHEREHVAARDPLLLALSAALLAITPWNPASWWLFVRLRAAVELDCDRRVLLRGANVGAYGAMLLGVAGRGSAPILTAALVEPAVLLERRIVAMTRNHPRRRGARTVALLTAGSIAALFACELNSPTTPAPAASDEAAVLEKVEVSPELERKLLVEKEALQKAEVSPELKRKLLAEKAVLEVVLSRVDGTAIRLEATGETVSVESEPAELRRSATLRQLEKTVPTRTLQSTIRRRTPAPDDPLIVVDGQIAGPHGLEAVAPDRIESVDVFKGAAAIRLYGEAGKHGVIRITTRK